MTKAEIDEIAARSAAILMWRMWGYPETVREAYTMAVETLAALDLELNNPGQKSDLTLGREQVRKENEEEDRMRRMWMSLGIDTVN